MASCRKRYRTPNDKFDIGKLINALEPFAASKKFALDWEFEAYNKSRRSQGPDREGLEHYSKLLGTILYIAPHGFPGHQQLKATWEQLQEDYKIMGKDVKAPIDKWSSQCADKVRLCCKHIVDLKKSDSPYMTPVLKSLVEQVVVETTITPTRRLLGKQNSDESVMELGYICRCPKCQEAVDVSSDPEKSEASVDACKNTRSVPAQRGGHKRALKIKKGDKDDPLLKKPAKAMKAMKAATKASDSETIKYKIVWRSNPTEKACGYILQNGKYLIGLSNNKSTEYKDILKGLQVDMEKMGTKVSKEDATKMINDRLRDSSG